MDWWTVFIWENIWKNSKCNLTRNSQELSANSAFSKLLVFSSRKFLVHEETLSSTEKTQSARTRLRKCGNVGNKLKRKSISCLITICNRTLSHNLVTNRIR